MSIFRVEKNKGYTVMSNHHLRNHTLSLKAKGLLSQILSLPEDWDYTLQGLARINKESVDAIREAVRELERAGYIKRSRERDEHGCLRGTVYTIYEQPQQETENPTQADPILEIPMLENPILEKPTLENPMQLNTERTKKKDKQKRMVGYRVRNTVTEFGSVARGVCEVKNGLLTGITERTKIFKRGQDAAFTEDGETFAHLPGDTIVSMNLWGFSAAVLDRLWNGLPDFLRENLQKNPLKCEYFLPSVVNAQLEDGSARVKVLPCEETWYGVTYREDLESVVSAVRTMKETGIYPKELWK